MEGDKSPGKDTEEDYLEDMAENEAEAAMMAAAASTAVVGKNTFKKLEPELKDYRDDPKSDEGGSGDGPSIQRDVLRTVNPEQMLHEDG